LAECQAMIALREVNVHISTIRRELRLLGIPRTKRKQYFSRNELRRVLWWCSEPTHPPPFVGVFGLDTALLIDIDECDVNLSDYIGQTSYETTQNMNELSGQSTRFNVVMAVDINVGVVASWVFPGDKGVHTTKEIFWYFLYAFLLPEIEGKNRVIMCDDLSCHLDQNVIELCAHQGHRILQRPEASPDFSYVESAFHRMKHVLHTRQRDIKPETFKLSIQEAIATITPEQTRHWASKCHYFVSGCEYSPYIRIPTLGQQTTN